uniref:Uncharacterized protein n=1 Tax=Nothoprocta perdicaria TaxID=30464 RepID=A0A8C6Z6P5_NOTPE
MAPAKESGEKGFCVITWVVTEEYTINVDKQIPRETSNFMAKDTDMSGLPRSCIKQFMNQGI